MSESREWQLAPGDPPLTSLWRPLTETVLHPRARRGTLREMSDGANRVTTSTEAMPANGRLPAVIATLGAWGLFFGGSLALQTVDAGVRWSTAAARMRLASAPGLPAWIFWGLHTILALAAGALALRGTRPLPSLWLRVVVVVLQLLAGFVVFAVMMIGYSCSLGDCL